jgi:hypothetical protein
MSLSRAPRVSAVSAVDRPADRDTSAPTRGADARLALLEARLARLEAVLAASGPRDAADARLLRAVLTATAGTRFTAAECVRHARVTPALEAALEDADIAGDGAVIQLGLLLRRLAGTTVDEWQLEPTRAKDRDGRIYRWRRWQE